MKKISILALHLGYGGIEKSITALANLLCEKYQVEIICIYKMYDKESYEIDPRVKINYLINSDLPLKAQSYKVLISEFHFLTLFKKICKDYFFKLHFLQFFHDSIAGIFMYPRRFFAVKKALKKDKSDVLISSRTFLNEWLGNYGREEALKIGWEHNHYHGNMQYAVDVVRSVKNLDFFVLVSQSLTDFYQKKLSKYKVECIYIPNILESLPKRLAPLDEKRLISVGRLSKEKGHLDLLKIYNILEKKHPDWCLDIIGDGPERDNLEEYIKKHHLEEKVTLHGFQNKKYIDSYLQKSSIYLMTSFTESFGIVLIEAMSHGLPCIAFSSAEGACELINSSQNGYLIKNRNFQVMIEKIEDLMEKKEERVRIGKASRESVLKYTKEVVGKEWIDLIEGK